MASVIKYDNKLYVTLPDTSALLYFEFSGKNSLPIVTSPSYFIDKIASTGIKYNFLNSEYHGTGQALFSISTGFYRGKIDPDKTVPVPKNLEGRIIKTNDSTSSSKDIRDVAETIRSQLPRAHQYNSCALIEGIMYWLKGNIEYTILPKNIIADVEKSVSELYGLNRLDPYQILKNSFHLDEAVLKKISAKVYLPASLRHASNDKIAGRLLNNKAVYPALMNYWLSDGESAQKTLESKSGKCVGISNLFAALCNQFQISSMRTGGYAYNIDHTNEGPHAWVVSNIAPYGLVEIDPHLFQFNNFIFDDHAYNFSVRGEDLPEVTLIEKGVKGVINRKISDNKIDSIVHLLEKDNRFYDKLLGKQKHKSEIEFLLSLK